MKGVTKMIKNYLVVFIGCIVSLLSISCKHGVFSKKSAQKKISHAYEEYLHSLNPIIKDKQSDPSESFNLSPLDEKEITRRMNVLNDLNQQIQGIEHLDLNGKILKSSIQSHLLLGEIKNYQKPFLNRNGFFNILENLYRAKNYKTVEDFEKLFKKWEKVPEYFDNNIFWMNQGIQEKNVHSKNTTQRALEIISGLRVPSLHSSKDFLFYSYLKDAPTQEIKEKGLHLINTVIKDAYEKLYLYFKDEYLPKATEQDGLTYNPQGKDFYKKLVKLHTTRNTVTPEEIHQIGLDEVKRIKSQMEKIIKEVKFKGSFQEFLTFLRTSKQFYAKTPQELLEKASYFAKQADLKMPEFFYHLPRLSYGIIPVPDHLAPGFTTGLYSHGNMKHGVSGKYWVNTYDLMARPLYELPALTVHEAVPGHHHQIAIAQELHDKHLPKYRVKANFTAYVEGWGLYAETIGEDMGMYQTPYEKFGRCSYEMWRALRLVVDTGIHYFGWTKEKAFELMWNNSALSKLNIITEIERYIADPGQALAYKMGEITIRKLKQKAQEEFKKNALEFDVREFHDIILKEGSMPLDVLEELVIEWINKKISHSKQG